MTLVFILAGGAYGAYYSKVLTYEEDTDNAYVGGNLVTLSSQVAGTVQEIRADDTQLVKAGTEIVKLDPVDAKLALRQAEARLGITVRKMRERYAALAQYAAEVAQRKVSLRKAEDDLARRAPLAADHTLSQEEVVHARQAVQAARAALEVAMRRERSFGADIAGVDLRHHPSVLAAKEAVIQAWLALRRTSILAPVTGYVAKRVVQVGAQVTPGMPLMTIAPLNQLWVDANFKESDLQNIRVGQPATIEADIYGSRVEYHGKVEGLSAGTGSAFALLPAQNASGNWIKVVQRVPVRISLDPKELAKHPLLIGLSTVVTVDTHRRGGAMLGSARPATPLYSTEVFKQPMQEAQAIVRDIVSRNLAK